MNNVVLITGATSGIGKAMAEKFASMGHDLVITGRRKTILEELAKHLMSRYQVEVFPQVCDLSSEKEIIQLVEEIQKRKIFTEILINNAGIFHVAPFLQLTLEQLDEMWKVNVRAPFLLTQQLLPAMIERKKGTVINISSLAGKNGFATGTGYCATKFALRGFAASLMMEVREHFIRVITIFPGSVNTPMMDHSLSRPIPDTIIQPEEVAEMAYAACSLPATAMVSEMDIRPTKPSYLNK